MEKFATQGEEICVVLVESIIQKSWEQPKYAASYAKLSSYFARIDNSKFAFSDSTGSKKNPFKFILIEKVQHSFDKRELKAPTEKDDIEKFAKEAKNLLMGNVKFIAELIKIKLLRKRTIKYCVSILIKNFLEGYYNFHKNKVTELNFYEYNFEALIEFLENLGEKYESIDEKEKAEKGEKGDKEDKDDEAPGKVYSFKEIEEKIRNFAELKKSYDTIEGLDNLKADEYFKIMKILDELVLLNVKDGRRLKALLQNLDERRFNNWRKHNVESEGPKKLKDLKFE